MKYEKGFSINSWYDGPRLGVANFSGKPHIYKSVWNVNKEEWESFYYLKAIDHKQFKLVLEDLEIWKKFEANFMKSEVNFYHPALSKARYHNDLQNLLNEIFEIDYSSAIKAKAEFKYKNKNYVVHWEKIV
jgi:hypothetical protein